MKTPMAKKNAQLVLKRETLKSPRVKTQIRAGKRASAQGPEELELEPLVAIP